MMTITAENGPSRKQAVGLGERISEPAKTTYAADTGASWSGAALECSSYAVAVTALRRQRKSKEHDEQLQLRLVIAAERLSLGNGIPCLPEPIGVE